MSWNKKQTNPFKLVNSGKEVDVIILDFDEEKRRLSLGMKQTTQNPWEAISKDFTVDSEREGEIANITEFGLFIKLTEEVDGLIHINDLSWSEKPDEEVKKYKKGDKVKYKVLEIDAEKERVALGIKQLEKDPFSEAVKEKLKKGKIVTCIIDNVLDTGLEVTIDNNLSGFIKRTGLSRDKDEQKSSRFAKGEKVDAMITSIDSNSRKILLSIKAMELEDEKQAMKDYGSADSGASLGDILGAALEAKSTKKDDKNEETKKKEEGVKKKESE